MKKISYVNTRFIPNEDIYIDKSVFIKLSTSENGGAIYCNQEYRKKLCNCLFSMCSSQIRGGAVLFSNGYSEIKNICLTKNSGVMCADIMSWIEKKFDYSFISSFEAKSTEHGFWAGATEYFYMSNMNSTYTPLEV